MSHSELHTNGRYSVTPSGRISFARVQPVIDYPDFLAVQLESFKEFLQEEVPPEERRRVGLQEVFLENFPIQDAREEYTLDFLYYTIEPPRYTIEECQERGLTYAVTLKARLRLSFVPKDEPELAEPPIEQDVYLGTIPYMTERGTFIINGAERVIVSQLHRSPGVIFGESLHPNGTKLYTARVIPMKGSWLEFATDVNNVMWVYIDRKKKFPVTMLLRALGWSTNEDILRLFSLSEEIRLTTRADFREKAVGRILATDVFVELEQEEVDEDTGEVRLREERRVLLRKDHVLQEGDYDLLRDAGVRAVHVKRRDEETSDESEVLLNTLGRDPTHSQQEALEYIYRQLRQGEPPDLETARQTIERLFFNEKKYDLGEVGRYRINKRLRLNVPIHTRTLTHEDLIAIIRELIDLLNGKAKVDDQDHLSNRRMRTVGEQLAAQFGVGLARMARTIRERLNITEGEQVTPASLVTARTITSVINSFFGTNQLSQFMDQTNPLAELTHKRRMSALGPGGLTRERAGFEVRDVHYTHYGRLCPIETPEGPNIGLISSLCVYAKVNRFGFLETPYRIVRDGKVTNEIRWLSAEEEDETIIAQATTPLDEQGRIAIDHVRARSEADYPVVGPDKVEYVDVAPNQIVSAAAALIPFLEHNDANRALMGSNMQRQAVPLLRTEAPIVGTGLEERVARDSRALIVAEGDGVVEAVDATRIVVRYDRSPEEELVSFDPPRRTYRLIKFRRTNQDTCINQKPVVRPGQRVKKGDVLADGYAIEHGELALGKNVLVAFMPWRGYNFEDAIVVSERLVAEDVFTSVHIDEFEHQVRETKRGEEEFTREIPNVSEEATKHLDENGIIRVGAEVRPNDILIGKITPKGETDPTPEEKLLRAIFGEKAGEVKDASLKAPPGLYGVVIDTKLFSRKRKDGALKRDEKQLLQELERRHKQEIAELNQLFYDKLFQLVERKRSLGIRSREGEILVPEGALITRKTFSSVLPTQLDVNADWVEDRDTNRLIRRLHRNYMKKYQELEAAYKREQFLIAAGDELPDSGILQLAKVYVAKKRKLQVGDKMAGRHGNKGVVAKIVPVEDMPFLEDGTPVDIVLNPLGVPSRMNLGQIYETLLGWAGKKLGVKFATPVFDGATYEDVKEWLRKAGLPEDGRVWLYDGRTGERLDRKVTVGYIYMMKLNHMVEDKIHARSIGPYSLITQQPLGGKAQFGGQRFGEMEVWALEAYGAANVLEEMLTYKSDDVQGRSKVYEAIVKGENLPEPGVPESFNVLVRELMGLGLEVRIE